MRLPTGNVTTPLQLHDPYGTADQGLQLRDVNVVVADTVRVAFVKNGLFYNVIMLGSDQNWLLNILKSWQFI